MRKLILLSTSVFMINACSHDSHQKAKQSIEQKDYLESYYEAEEVRYENYLKQMAD